MSTGTGWKRLGPANGNGEARIPHTGSVRIRWPSISSNTVEWPSQVARSPVSTGRLQVARGSLAGSGRSGVRPSPRNRKSTSVGRSAGSRPVLDG
ncbi:hypothetical protein ACFS3C_01740 [Azotobacter vinelandii]